MVFFAEHREYKRIVAASLIISIMGSLTGCRHQDNEFPDVPFPSVETTVETETSQTEEAPVVIPDISVALPYSPDTVKYLSELFYAKENDLLGKSTGDNVELSFLDTLNPGFVISSIRTSNEGAGLDSVNEWKTSAVPDVFLVNDVKSIADSGCVRDLNLYLSKDEYFASKSIYTDSLSQAEVDGKIYGIPHYMSMYMVFGNLSYVPENGKLPVKYTTDELEEYLTDVREKYEDVIPMSSARKMIPYIVSSFNNDRKTSYMCYDEYKTDPKDSEKIINKAASYVTGLYKDKLSSNFTSNDVDPVRARECALWVGSSSELSYWNDFYSGNLFFTQLPCGDVSNKGIPVTSVYSLCIGKNCAYPDFAARFAAFISWDTDALLLINRLEPHVGFLPVVNSGEVWQKLGGNDSFGQLAALVSQNCDNAVYVPQSRDNELFKNVSSYIGAYDGGEIDPRECYGN